MLLETESRDAFSSFSMVDIGNLGYNIMSPDPFRNRLGLSFAPYMCLDGMNEHGLAVGHMMVPEEQPDMDPELRTITDTGAIRLLLDNAEDVPRAIKLLKQYNICFPVTVNHYLIADRNGDCALVEYVNGEMIVMVMTGSFQIATNFTISGTDHETRMLDARYASAWNRLSSVNGDISQDEAMELLEDISQSHTMWSVVYNLTTGDVLVAPGRRYDHVYRYNLEMTEE
jgi:predicted choloylglycine hydrolase